jgi:plastocyanin
MSSHPSVIRASLLLLTIAALGCGGSGGADKSTGPGGGTNPSTATVAATPALAFTPATATVASGGTVTWDFGTVAHSVAFDRSDVTDGRDANGYYTGGTSSAPDDIPPVQGTTVSRTFASPGTYTYHCLLHAGMNGTVVVR